MEVGTGEGCKGEKRGQEDQLIKQSCSTSYARCDPSALSLFITCLTWHLVITQRGSFPITITLSLSLLLPSLYRRSNPTSSYSVRVTSTTTELPRQEGCRRTQGPARCSSLDLVLDRDQPASARFQLNVERWSTSHIYTLQYLHHSLLLEFHSSFGYII